MIQKASMKKREIRSKLKSKLKKIKMKKLTTTLVWINQNNLMMILTNKIVFQIYQESNLIIKRGIMIAKMTKIQNHSIKISILMTTTENTMTRDTSCPNLNLIILPNLIQDIMISKTMMKDTILSFKRERVKDT